MNIFENKERKATYTVEVPIKFTFCASNSLDCYELHEAAKKELVRRLVNGYFDVLSERAEVVDKVTHYTLEEKIQQEREWENFVNGR